MSLKEDAQKNRKFKDGRESLVCHRICLFRNGFTMPKEAMLPFQFTRILTMKRETYNLKKNKTPNNRPAFDFVGKILNFHEILNRTPSIFILSLNSKTRFCFVG